MSATNAFETALLEHYFQNEAHANVGDSSGLQPSSTAGVFWISLHTASPGETGDQSTSEANYTGYARVSVARDDTAWTVVDDLVSNAAPVSFPECTGGSSTVTHFGIGSAETSTGNLFFVGTLDSTLEVTNLVTPLFAIGNLKTSVN